MSRLLGELEVSKPCHLTREADSMDHAMAAAALLATPFAASLLPLSFPLLPVIVRIGQLIVTFRSAAPTPSSCHHFEVQLHDRLRELGLIIVAWTYNHIEPDDPLLMPGHLRFDGDWYRRRAKTPNRAVATLFGTITLWRYLYQPIHGLERAIFPLEIRLGLVAGHATPALAERVAHAATESTQETVRADLKRDRGVAWSVATLRNVIAATWEGMAPHLHDAQVAQVLAWLKQAHQSRGSRKPVLAVGRDGVFVPIRGDDSYREAATATVSVYDRAGKRLGTVYLGQMPEPGQGTLSEQLTRLITDVLAGWSEPLPRLAYITDAGHHPTEYFEQVLKRMRHPCRPGEAPGMGVGRRLLPCLQLHPRPVRDVVPRPAAGACLGAEDVPLVEDEAACDLPDPTLGGGDPEPSLGGGSVEGVPGRVRLPAKPHQAPGLRAVSPEPSADRQWSDGGGVQDGVQSTSEAVGDGLERGGRPADRRPSGHPFERGVVAGALLVPPIEEPSRGADSTT